MIKLGLCTGLLLSSGVVLADQAPGAAQHENLGQLAEQRATTPEVKAGSRGANTASSAAT